MGKTANSERHEEGGKPLVTDTLEAIETQSAMTLAERANLARNLYALHDWLRTHLEP